jgi:hypothetical protein
MSVGARLSVRHERKADTQVSPYKTPFYVSGFLSVDVWFDFAVPFIV